MTELRGFDGASIALARRRGLRERATDTTRVEYVPESDSLRIVLRNRTVVSVPRRAIEGLKKVPKTQIIDVHLSPIGDAIELSEFDIHISVKGVVRQAVFGEDIYALAGRTKSAAKAAAARKNGAKGGRPRRVA